MHLKQLCQNSDYVNYSRPIGSGTHGFVYERTGYPELAIKIFSNETKSCTEISQKEYGIHELISNNFLTEFQHFRRKDDHDLVRIPRVYGFKYLPNTYNPLCCSYEMERINSLPGFDQLIQLTLSFSPDYQESMSQGYYVGLQALSKILQSINQTQLYGELIYYIGVVYGIFHFKFQLDANDIRLVLGRDQSGQIKMFVIDFDKVNQFPSSLLVKLTENDYQPKTFTHINHLYRYLATTLHMFPPLETPESQLAIDGYQQVAEYYHQREAADQILAYYRDYQIT